MSCQSVGRPAGRIDWVHQTEQYAPMGRADQFNQMASRGSLMRQSSAKAGLGAGLRAARTSLQLVTCTPISIVGIRTTIKTKKPVKKRRHQAASLNIESCVSVCASVRLFGRTAQATPNHNSVFKGFAFLARIPAASPVSDRLATHAARAETARSSAEARGPIWMLKTRLEPVE